MRRAKAIKMTAMLALAMPATAVQAQDPLGLPDFAATQISQGPAGTPEIGPLKVYKSGTKYRTERAQGQIVIWDAAHDKVYSMRQNGANCMVLPLNQAPMMSSVLQFPMGTKMRKKPVGTEEMEGHTCTVAEVELTAADGTTLHAKMWEAKDLEGFPVKIEALGRPTFIFRDIVLATPDASLFKPPKCLPLEKIKPRTLPSDPGKSPSSPNK
jgi:hypothetical protein